MRLIISTSMQLCRKGLLVLALVCLCSFAWVGFPQQSSYAAAKPTVSQTSQTQSNADLKAREESYEEAKEIADDPKMGIEKEYEKEIEAYREEHGEGGIIEEAKDLVTKVTGN